MAVKSEMSHMDWLASQSQAAIAQFGERQTEDLKVPGSITAGQKNRQYSEQCSEASFRTPKCCTHEAKCRFRSGIVVSISACPGSIPGRGVFSLMLHFSLSQVQAKKQQPGHLVPPSDGNNELPASAFSPKHDSVSERLRRWTRNPLGSARRGSNPLAVVADFEHRSNGSNDARPLQGVAAA